MHCQVALFSTNVHKPYLLPQLVRIQTGLGLWLLTSMPLSGCHTLQLAMPPQLPLQWQPAKFLKGALSLPALLANSPGFENAKQRCSCSKSSHQAYNASRPALHTAAIFTGQGVVHVSSFQASLHLLCWWSVHCRYGTEPKKEIGCM